MNFTRLFYLPNLPLNGLHDFPERKFSEDAGRNDAIDAYYRNKNLEGEEVCANNASFRTNLEGAYRFTNRNYRMPQIAAYAR